MINNEKDNENKPKKNLQPRFKEKSENIAVRPIPKKQITEKSDFDEKIVSPIL